MRGAAVAGVLALLIAGCGDGSADGEDAGADAGRDGSTDAGGEDASSPEDGGTDDAGTRDGGGSDGGTGIPDPVPERFRFCDDGASGTVMDATPSDYRSKLDAMSPGDTLRLAAGTYDQGLPIRDMNGSEGSCFVIEGPASGDAAVFTGSSSRNTVSIVDSSYVVVRNLELDGIGEVGDAVKAEGTADYAHHIVLEGLRIHDHDAGQQIVGISTKCPAWRWVIRDNHIESTGTGLYLGNSDGNDPFVDGLIEHNVVLDTLGYNMQIKHQNPRPDLDGLPESGTTIIRHNVFSKQNDANGGSQARPNLLVGHFPTSGPGVDDQYLIYGNFFHDNPVEALFQGEGNVALYANVMLNPNGPAVHIQPHNDVPKRIHVFFNTVVANGRGVRVSGADTSFEQVVAGNAVFADPLIDGGEQRDNVTDTMGAAGDYLANPTGTPGSDLDMHPQSDALTGSVDTSGLDGFPAWDRDFDGRARDAMRRGAYVGPAGSGSWPLDRARKP